MNLDKNKVNLPLTKEFLTTAPFLAAAAALDAKSGECDGSGPLDVTRLLRLLRLLLLLSLQSTMGGIGDGIRGNADLVEMEAGDTNPDDIVAIMDTRPIHIHIHSQQTDIRVDFIILCKECLWQDVK